MVFSFGKLLPKTRPPTVFDKSSVTLVSSLFELFFPLIVTLVKLGTKLEFYPVFLLHIIKNLFVAFAIVNANNVKLRRIISFSQLLIEPNKLVLSKQG